MAWSWCPCVRDQLSGKKCPGCGKSVYGAVQLVHRNAEHWHMECALDDWDQVKPAPSIPFHPFFTA